MKGQMESFSDGHPANYDQQIEMAKELLGRSTQWMLFAFEPGEREEEHIAHGVYGGTPGGNVMDFIEFVIHSLQEITKDLVGGTIEEGDNGGEKE